MQAQTEPQTNPCFSNSTLTCAGSMCPRSSTGISTVSKPQRLNCLNSFVLSFVKGDVKRNVLIPSRILSKLIKHVILSIPRSLTPLVRLQNFELFFRGQINLLQRH